MMSHKKKVGLIQWTLLRYMTNYHRSIGLLYERNKLECYTIEDAERNKKIWGETAIWKGNYRLLLREELTPLTIKYRDRFPWFTWHIEITGVKDFDNTYVHVGNDEDDTEGCVCVGSKVYRDVRIEDSVKAFERFYKKVQPRLLVGQEVWLRVAALDIHSQI